MTHQNAALLLGTLLAAAVVGVSKLGYDEFAVVRNGFILRFYDAPVLKQGLFAVFADLTMIATALYLAVGLKYDDWGVSVQRPMVLAIVPLLTAVTLATFAIMEFRALVEVVRELERYFSVKIFAPHRGAIRLDLQKRG